MICRLARRVATAADDALSAEQNSGDKAYIKADRQRSSAAVQSVVASRVASSATNGAWQVALVRDFAGDDFSACTDSANADVAG